MAVEITRTFDVKHDIPVMTIQFDSLLGEYPKSFVVRYYSDDVEICSKYVTPTDYIATVSQDLARDINKIVILITGTLPNYRVRIDKISYNETDFSLDFDSIKQSTQTVSKIEKLRNVLVNEYTYAQENDSSELYSGTTESKELHIEFNEVATNVTVTVTPSSALKSYDLYGRAIDLHMNSGSKTIMITGKTLTEKSVTHTYSVNVNGEDDAEENPLITNSTMADALAEHIESYLQLRNTYESDYRGNPELEVGDIIGVETQFSSERYGLVLVNSLEFNGGWSGTLTVKGLE